MNGKKNARDQKGRGIAGTRSRLPDLKMQESSPQVIAVTVQQILSPGPAFHRGGTDERLRQPSPFVRQARIRLLPAVYSWWAAPLPLLRFESYTNANYDVKLKSSQRIGFTVTGSFSAQLRWQKAYRVAPATALTMLPTVLPVAQVTDLVLRSTIHGL